MENTPDYRNQFLRGYGSKTGAVGTYQHDMGRNATGKIGFVSGGITAAGNAFQFENYFGTHIKAGVVFQNTGKIKFDLKNEWGKHAGDEFRPENIAVRYLVRAKN